MNINKFEKEAFGNSFRGKILSAIEMGIIYTAGVNLFFYFMLKVILKFPNRMGMPNQDIPSFLIGFFIFGFIVGCTRSYPLIFARFIHPSENEIRKYKAKKMKDINLKIQNGVIEMDEHKAKVRNLETELSELKFMYL